MNVKRAILRTIDTLLRTAAVTGLVFGFAWLLVQWAAHRPAVIADQGGGIRLLAKDATTHGPDIRFNTRYGEPNIGWWDRQDQSLSWTVDHAQGGRYQASLRYSRPGSAPVGLELMFGPARLVGEAPGTGGWNQWRTIQLGTIDLPPTPAQTVTLKGFNLPSEGVINFVELILSPIE